MIVPEHFFCVNCESDNVGIRTDPGYRLYGVDNTCFPTGKTPTKMYVTFSGIKKNPDYPPEGPEPLNGTFLLERRPSGFWSNGLSNPYIVFYVQNGYSVCRIMTGDDPQMPMFEYEHFVECKFSGDNDIQYPTGWYYYGGSFSAVPKD